MRRLARRALLAGAVPALLLPSAASATCTAVACVGVPSAVLRLTDVIGSGPGGGGGDGSGVLCFYEKTKGSPPPGYTGDASAGGPYFWVQTQKWGSDHRGTYDVQICPALICPPPLPGGIEPGVCTRPES